MDDGTEYSSWVESRRLIISQLAAMDSSIRDLSNRVDRFNDAARERSIEMSEKAAGAVNGLNIRVSMLELRAKLWGGAVGAIVSIVVTIVAQLMLRGLKP